MRFHLLYYWLIMEIKALIKLLKEDLKKTTLEWWNLTSEMFKDKKNIQNF